MQLYQSWLAFKILWSSKQDQLSSELCPPSSKMSETSFQAKQVFLAPKQLCVAHFAAIVTPLLRQKHRRSSGLLKRFLPNFGRVSILLPKPDNVKKDISDYFATLTPNLFVAEVCVSCKHSSSQATNAKATNADIYSQFSKRVYLGLLFQITSERRQ